MKKNARVFLGLCAVFLFLLIISKFITPSSAATTHIVISEVQVADSSSSNSADFIELYNPTDIDINMGDLRLVKRTSSSASDSGIIAFTAAHVIPSHGYFLWCNTVLNNTLSCDASTAGTIGNTNSIGLRMDPSETGTLIDSVTLGTPANPLGEGTFLPVLADGKSAERKANATSTTASMTTGVDMLLGNAQDTDSNASDFVVRDTPQPQKKTSDKEPVATTPTITVTSSPTVTPTLTLTPSPTLSPTMSPTVTMTPTPTSSPSLTISPTITPSAMPSVTTVPSVTPTAMVTPTPSTPPPFVIPKYKLVCAPKTITVHVLTRTINISYPVCIVVKY